MPELIELNINLTITAAINEPPMQKSADISLPVLV
jgi:hypothetical protein